MATAVIMPRQGQSVESCILVEWLVKPGQNVKVGTPLASIETDKAVFEVESAVSGTVLELFFEAGADVPVLTPIAAIGAPGEDVTALRPQGGGAVAPSGTAPETTAVGAATHAPQAVAGTRVEVAPVGMSPRARRAAEAKGVDAAHVTGSGPGGRVIERDVLAAAAEQPRVSPAARAAAAAGTAIPPRGSGPGGMVLVADLAPQAASPATAPVVATPTPTAQETVPLKGVRKLIAQRMRDSLAGTAQITLTMSFDATALLNYRARVKAHGDALGLPNITVTDMIAFALARTLRRHPALNAHFLGDRIVRFPNVHLGIATDSERGLMVPVVKQADTLSLRELSTAIKALAQAAQGGAINPDLLTGGTFTLTNLGMFGVEAFTPVLNAPEVAILGVGAPVWKPMAGGDPVRFAQAITLSLTVDHQVVDGAPAARFLKDLCEVLANVDLLSVG